MAKGTAGKNYWALLLMILAGVVLGGFIGQLSAGVPALRWLNYRLRICSFIVSRPMR